LHKWTKKHAQLVGNIIFTNFLKLSLTKYKNVIEEVKSSVLFKKSLRNRADHMDNDFRINIKRLPKTYILHNKINPSPETVARIAKSSKGFGLQYVYEGFNEVYVLSGMQHSKLFYKLRRINSRNELTHRIIEGIIEHQKKFLSTGNPIDLTSFSQVQLVKWLNRSRSSKIYTNWTSLLVNRLSIILPSGEKRILKSFFPTRKNINKRHIKQLLDKENEDVEFKKPLTDEQIKVKLNGEYGVKLSRRSINIYRKEMGIPSARKRLSGYKYPPLLTNFSMLHSLTAESVQNNAPSSPGIYEFRLNDKEIRYPKKKTNVIYIGSTKNIKKRLKEHVGRNNKNAYIKRFLVKFDLSFRYVLFSKNWKEEERVLYNLFVATYGAPPKCNRITPGLRVK